MSSNLTKFKEDLARLIKTGEDLCISLAIELDLLTSKQKEKVSDRDLPSFTNNYENWYSESLQVVKQLLPDRLNDFTSLYKNEKRKNTDYLTYTISDYMIGLQVTRGVEVKVDKKAAFPKFQQQYYILESIKTRFESSLYDIKQILQYDLFDDELDCASELYKKGFLRGAGAIAGVVIEKHLGQVCSNHNIRVSKKNPGIADFNDILKNNDVVDVATWRFIQHLADIRNLCDHNKDREPNKDEVEDLIAGVRKIIKTLF